MKPLGAPERREVVPITDDEVRLCVPCSIPFCNARRGEHCVTPDNIRCGCHGKRRMRLTEMPAKRRHEMIAFHRKNNDETQNRDTKG